MLSSCLFNYQEFPFSGVQLFCMFRNPVSSPCERLTFSGKTTVLLRSRIFFQISFHPLFRGSPFQGFLSNTCARYDAIKMTPFSGYDVFAITLKWLPFSGRVLSSCLFDYQGFPFSGVQLFCMFRHPVSSPCQRLRFSGKNVCPSQELYFSRFRYIPFSGAPLFRVSYPKAVLVTMQSKPIPFQGATYSRLF